MGEAKRRGTFEERKAEAFKNKTNTWKRINTKEDVKSKPDKEKVTE